MAIAGSYFALHSHRDERDSARAANATLSEHHNIDRFLQRIKIFVSEQWRIPYAGFVTICCFDKTGTLTADEFKVQGVVNLTVEDSTPKSATTAAAAPGSAQDKSLSSATTPPYSASQLEEHRSRRGAFAPAAMVLPTLTAKLLGIPWSKLS